LSAYPKKTPEMAHLELALLVAQAGMLGLKPFSSWRALARSLGELFTSETNIPAATKPRIAT
jgi:hypothetical protein